MKFQHYNIGLTFNDLRVVSFFKDETGRIAYICKCNCGTLKKISRSAIGSQKSCGCRVSPAVIASNKRRAKHNGCLDDRKTGAYKSWTNMKARCLNRNKKFYAYYGGRGITICDRWKNSFENFLSDMGERPEGLTLDRIDPNGNYEPLNCRWASRYEQIHNRRKKNV